MNKITFEGFTAEQILELDDNQVNELIFCNKTIVFQVGTSEVLGQFSITQEKLVIELAQIDGGGEGVLPAIMSLSNKLALKRGLKEMEWIVHAVNCAKPNLKLRKLLERRGFKKKMMNDIEVYHDIQSRIKV